MSNYIDANDGDDTKKQRTKYTRIHIHTWNRNQLTNVPLMLRINVSVAFDQFDDLQTKKSPA